MDIEKAIECLKADKEYLTDNNVCDGEEMDIAIKALEKQKELKENCDGNCIDCLYRGDNRCANDLLIDNLQEE